MKPESMGTLQSGHAGDRCGTIPPLRRNLMGWADLTTSMHGPEHSTGFATSWSRAFQEPPPENDTTGDQRTIG